MKPVMNRLQVERLATLRSHIQKGDLTALEWGEIRRLEEEFVSPPLLDTRVGTPATYAIGSDRYAGEVVSVRKNGQEIWFRSKGSSGEGEPFTYRGVSGCYVSKGSSYGVLLIGTAEDYRDPSF